MKFNFFELRGHIIDLFTNRVMICAVLSWLMAQFIKIFTAPREHKGQKFSFRRFLVGSGGMPSSHSAVVSATCISCGIIYGFNSAYFAISAVLAVVVMRDASGIRREAGKQAEVINQMSRQLGEREDFSQVTLSELLGHTPLQVLFGALLGIAMAYFCQEWFFDLVFPAGLMA